MLDLERLMKLSEKATPGPWIPSKFGSQVLTGDSWSTICELKGPAEWEDRRGAYEQEYEWQRQEANAKLIVLSREALPDLILALTFALNDLERMEIDADFKSLMIADLKLQVEYYSDWSAYVSAAENARQALSRPRPAIPSRLERLEKAVRDVVRDAAWAARVATSGAVMLEAAEEQIAILRQLLRGPGQAAPGKNKRKIIHRWQELE